MPKQKGKNPFYYFLLDYRQKHKCSMRAATEGAGRAWEKMGENERQPYIQKSGAARNAVKMTTFHEKIDDIENEQKFKVDSESMMRNDIETMIQRYMACNTINTEYFHIIHMNNFCYSNSVKRHYPAELAIVRFNLMEGILPENIYHERIQPGKLPLGYAHIARKNASETHQIPVPNDDAENNMDSVFQKLRYFLQESSFTKEVPPIYVSVKFSTMITEMLQQMCNDFSYDKSNLRIYSLEYLLFVLKNALHDHVVWPTVNQSLLEIEKDVFSFTDYISCSYHEETDVPIHCSRSIVVRHAYIVCDNCCKAANIVMIPGQHVPEHSRFTIDVKETIECDKYDDQRSVITTSEKPSIDNRSISAYDNQSSEDDDNDRDEDDSDADEWSTQMNRGSESSYHSRDPRVQNRDREREHDRRQRKAAPRPISRRPFTMSASVAGVPQDSVVSDIVFRSRDDSDSD